MRIISAIDVNWSLIASGVQLKGGFIIRLLLLVNQRAEDGQKLESRR
jgi:hypothetical protein